MTNQDFLAELDADHQAKAAQLRASHEAQRAAMAPAAELAAAITASRTQFLSQDQEQMKELSAALKKAATAGVPRAYLDRLALPPIVEAPTKRTRTAGPRRPRKKSAPTTPAAVADKTVTEAPPVSHPREQESMPA